MGKARRNTGALGANSDGTYTTYGAYMADIHRSYVSHRSYPLPVTTHTPVRLLLWLLG